MQRMLVVGAKGMLGHDIVKTFTGQYELTGVDIDTMDITDMSSVERVFGDVRPHIVINCSAFTNVDACETEQAAAFAVNAHGVRNLAAASRQCDAVLVHYSTDYVFDGSGTAPWTEESIPAPLNVYGASKFKGEEHIRQLHDAHLILRTSWLYGKNGKNFVTTILKLVGENKQLRVVNDQVGAPTYTVDLAAQTRALLDAGCRGTFNACNEGWCSWYDFARAILEEAGVTGVEVLPVDSDAFPRPAARPRNSRLNMNKLRNATGAPFPPWRDALHRYLKEIGLS